MVNNVVLVGRMTKDPELKEVAGKACADFTLALDRGYGEKKATDYVPCTAWNSNAENLCRFCGKGSLIAVTGRIQTRSYKDSDGKVVNAFEVVASRIQFIDTRKGEISEESGNEVAAEDESELLESLDSLDELFL